MFDLSQRVLSETEIQVLQKGLDFAPIQKSINERELRKDFEDFSGRMRNAQPFEDFSDKPAFRSKSNWKPVPGHPGLIKAIKFVGVYYVERTQILFL